MRVLVAALVLAAGTARAMDVVPLTLDRVVERAGSVVHGIVTQVSSGRDETGLPATWVSLEVLE
ncbi:MAG: hypothetical protein ACREQL_06935, partial [Candidatus Binatia bacterium]